MRRAGATAFFFARQCSEGGANHLNLRRFFRLHYGRAEFHVPG
jgi:hypothetical protein